MSKFMCPLGRSSGWSRWSLTARHQRRTCLLLRLEELELLLHERRARVGGSEGEELLVGGDRRRDVVRALRGDAELQEGARVVGREQGEGLVDPRGLSVGVVGGA